MLLSEVTEETDILWNGGVTQVAVSISKKRLSQQLV
jgi:hypothetical protein